MMLVIDVEFLNLKKQITISNKELSKAINAMDMDDKLGIFADVDFENETKADVKKTFVKSLSLLLETDMTPPEMAILLGTLERSASLLRAIIKKSQSF